LQGGYAASVEPDPLALVAVDGDGDAHSARTHLKGQDFARGRKLRRLEDMELLRLKVNLDEASAKEVYAQQAVNGALARAAQPAQIHRNVILGQGCRACRGRDALQSVACENGCDPAHRDCVTQVQSEPVGSAAVYDADPGAGVQEEVERLGRLGNGNFDPEQTFVRFERYLGRDILGGLRSEKSNSESGYGPKGTKHTKPYAEAVPSSLPRKCV